MTRLLTRLVAFMAAIDLLAHENESEVSLPFLFTVDAAAAAAEQDGGTGTAATATGAFALSFRIWNGRLDRSLVFAFLHCKTY